MKQQSKLEKIQELAANLQSLAEELDGINEDNSSQVEELEEIIDQQEHEFYALEEYAEYLQAILKENGIVFKSKFEYESD